MSKPRILVIRGGAIGDFILTLPALELLREHFPSAHIELLGYPHIAAIAHQRHYLDAVRSIEYGPLSGFFNPRSELDDELQDYFASFGQIISYLYDPDGFFEFNLRRSGVENLIVGNPLITGEKHASDQLAEPLQQLAIFAEGSPARIHPHTGDLAASREHLGQIKEPFVAIHPGSGSPKKNWAPEKWQKLCLRLLDEGYSIATILGESDGIAAAYLHSTFSAQSRVRFLENLPLPTLAALFQQSTGFVGHDSGISHLAAASGCPSVLLFGPTLPEVWAPRGESVRILSSPSGDLNDLTVNDVHATCRVAFAETR